MTGAGKRGDGGGIVDGVLLTEFFEELELGVGDGAGVLRGALGFGGEEVAIALRVFVAGADGVADAGDSAAGVAFDLSAFLTEGLFARGVHGLGPGAARAVGGDAGGGGFAERGGGVEEGRIQIVQGDVGVRIRRWIQLRAVGSGRQ